MLGTPWVRLGAELVPEVERLERGRDVRFGDFRGRLVLHCRKHQRDDALGDRGVAVGEEVEPFAVLHRIDPDAGGAAAHQRCVGLERLRHGIELAAELDQQAVALVAVEELVFFKDVFEAAHVARL